MTLLSKHEKRDPRRLPIGANLLESLILSLFLYYFTCSVTVDIPSPHASSGKINLPAALSTPDTRIGLDISHPVLRWKDCRTHTRYVVRRY